ncbi:MAG: hypothetical protein EAX86_03500 [Candidatus Heimdallarchaeota archaeon]|nr:hypothetical protein [Candidatus Heimdallarchaeota archaeon]
MINVNRKTTTIFITGGFLCIFILPFITPSSNFFQIDQSSDTFQTTWEAMISQKKTDLETLPSYSNFPENATSWTDYAEKSIEDLMIFDLSWIIEPITNIKGFRPYVKGTDGWGGADRIREIVELMSTMDVIWPLYQYLRLFPSNTSRMNILEDMINDLPDYYNPITKQSTNRPNEGKHDSWYFMENSVLKWGHLYSISNETVLGEPYFGSLQSAIDMAHNFNYLFPQFVDPITKYAASGYNTVNYCTGGLLAYSLITAYELTGNITLLEEADKILATMRLVQPPYMLLYEPQELAAAVAASAKLIQYDLIDDIIDTPRDFVQLALEFFYAEQQAMYYNHGSTGLENFYPQSSDWLPLTWRDGLYSPYYNPKETGGINAPAAKENIESIIFWVDLFKFLYKIPNFKAIEPLKIFNLNRINHFYFFSPNIPDEQERPFGPTSLQYIPYEDIDYYAVREYEPESYRYLTGYNGKEIYGAGETFWLMLLFEALAESSDRNAMILNLNIFDRGYPTTPNRRQFIVFNPYTESKTLEFTLKQMNAPYNIYANGSLLLENIQPGEAFNITLPSLGSSYLTINSDNMISFEYTPKETNWLTTATSSAILTETSTTTATTTPQSHYPSLEESVPIIIFLIGSLIVLTIFFVKILQPKK